MPSSRERIHGGGVALGSHLGVEIALRSRPRQPLSGRSYDVYTLFDSDTMTESSKNTLRSSSLDTRTSFERVDSLCWTVVKNGRSIRRSSQCAVRLGVGGIYRSRGFLSTDTAGRGRKWGTNRCKTDSRRSPHSVDIRQPEKLRYVYTRSCVSLASVEFFGSFRAERCSSGTRSARVWMRRAPGRRWRRRTEPPTSAR